MTDGASAPALEPTTGPLTFEELQLTAGNRGMPLEALRYDLTPTGLHYLLIHGTSPMWIRTNGGFGSAGWCSPPSS